MVATIRVARGVGVVLRGRRGRRGLVPVEIRRAPTDRGSARGDFLREKAERDAAAAARFMREAKR